MSKNTEVHFSSASNEWETPPSLFEWISHIYRFTLDPCCTHGSAKCFYHFTVADDGLSKSWDGETVFMNPPYGNDIGKWVKKAYEESQNGGATVVCLIPARTDTSWWYEYCTKAARILFITGRVHFIQGEKQAAAPFPSCFVVFQPDCHLCRCDWFKLGLDIRRGSLDK